MWNCKCLGGVSAGFECMLSCFLRLNWTIVYGSEFAHLLLQPTGTKRFIPFCRLRTLRWVY
jgi:hypothetical protein